MLKKIQHCCSSVGLDAPFAFDAEELWVFDAFLQVDQIGYLDAYFINPAFKVHRLLCGFLFFTGHVL